jgi:hypothetical protein
MLRKIRLTNQRMHFPPNRRNDELSGVQKIHRLLKNHHRWKRNRHQQIHRQIHRTNHPTNQLRLRQAESPSARRPQRSQLLVELTSL